MKKQITTPKQLEKVVNEMVKDLESELSIHKKYKVFKTNINGSQYKINIIADDEMNIITSAAIHTVDEIKNAYDVFYRLLMFYHADIYEYKGNKYPTIEISIGGLF